MNWNWYRVAVWAFVSGLLVYVVFIPTTQWISGSFSTPTMGRDLDGNLSLPEQVRLRSTEAITAFLFAAFGATIGSFLNVVVYRVPRGKSVIFESSSCPGCKSKIHRWDNIPILGWLLLNGRCRNCQIPISLRYPIVELTAAIFFLLLYFGELISGGANVPIRDPNLYKGVVWIIFYTKWDLVALYFFHCFSMSILLTWGLVDVDRLRTPTSNLQGAQSRIAKIPLWVSSGVCSVLLLLPILQPDLLPVPWLHKRWFDIPDGLRFGGTGVAGGITGAMLGWLANRAVKEVNPQKATTSERSVQENSPLLTHAISAGLVVGLSVGWQAAVGIWCLAFLGRPIFRSAARRWNFSEPPITLILMLSFGGHLLGWRWLTAQWWPSYSTAAIAWAFWGVGLASLLILNRTLPVYSAENLGPCEDQENESRPDSASPMEPATPDVDSPEPGNPTSTESTEPD
ncbi:MAG: prepilin peptidase [Planctomycetota bacterium]|nr:prepilin peptidase [Planctomycetota bacterium]